MSLRWPYYAVFPTNISSESFNSSMHAARLSHNILLDLTTINKKLYKIKRRLCYSVINAALIDEN
jgi:cation transporter-like permease